MAKRTGLSRQTINTIEQGKSVPGVDKVELIASAFGLSLTEFYAAAVEAN